MPIPAPNAHIDGGTRLLALLGWPVEHSLSPGLQNAALLSAGLNLCYMALPVPPDQLAAAVAGLRAIGAAGWNITIPHKQAILPLLDELSPAVAAIGAANTVVVKDGRLIGHNTDVAGFLEGLREAGFADDAGARGKAIVLGAGGAARAVVWALSSLGMRVTLLARRAAQADELLRALGTAPMQHSAATLDAPTLQAALNDANLLVNCTPTGTWPHADETPLPPGVELPPRLLVYDLVYNPRQTLLLRQAAARGCRTQGGIAMLINQGAAAFRLWTGVEPDKAAMRAAVERALGQQ